MGGSWRAIALSLRWLKHAPENVFRAKGVLWFQESPARHFFQLTGKRFQLEDDKWPGDCKNQLVFIGRNLDQGALQQLLEGCLVPVAQGTHN